MNVTIQFFARGEKVEYQIRPGVWIPCEIIRRTEIVGRYLCRYTPDDEGAKEKDGVVDSHNLRDPSA